MCSVYFFKISIHALREEGDLREPPPQTAPSQFLSTPSARRATAVHGPEDLVDTISIHALREEGDSVTSASATRTADFYPRPPRGGRPGACLRVILHPDISIHALREEGDRAYGLIYNEWFRFLSTPSARRATGRIDYETHRRNIFLSTPSARRATQQPERMGDRHQISIHALREEGDQKGHTERRRQAISIHALREEGDIPESYTELDGSVFLSTPSARRATYASRRHRQHRANFYPRPPRGGRLPSMDRRIL